MSDPVIISARPRVAVACGCVLGETPVWDERTGTLIWVDIRAHEVLSWQPGTPPEPVRIGLPEPVAFAVLTPRPDIVLVGLKSGIARLDLARRRTEMLLPRPSSEPPDNRLNDSCVGPDGSLYYGSMDDGEGQPSGSFYHWSARGVARFGVETIVTNGPALDPERRVLYTSDTTAGIIYRHRLADDGSPGEGERFIGFDHEIGHPDGLTLDAEGHLWVCHFGGSRATRFDPAGRAAMVLPMPTAQVTKIAFGGPDLAIMYLTTAARGRDPHLDPMAGHLFAVEIGIRGRPAGLCLMGEA